MDIDTDDEKETSLAPLHYYYTEEHPYFKELHWNTKQCFKKLLQQWLQFKVHRDRTFLLKNGIWFETLQSLQVVLNDFLFIKQKKPSFELFFSRSQSKHHKNKRKRNRKKSKKKSMKKSSKSEDKLKQTFKNVKLVLYKLRYYYLEMNWDEVKDEILLEFKKSYQTLVINYKTTGVIVSSEISLIKKQTLFCKDTIMMILKDLCL